METILGLIAAFLTTAAFVPQVLLVLRTRQTAGVSLGMYLIFTAGVALWLVYGVMVQSWPIILANVATLALALMMVVMKLRFK